MKDEYSDIIEWISREKEKTQIKLMQADQRGDMVAAGKIREKIHNYAVAIKIIKAAKVISEGEDMITEKEIITQCERCSTEYKDKEGCPKERGCGSIMLLACRIQSMEYDNRKQEGK